MCPPRVNPADLLLDVVGGDFPPEWRASHPDFRASDLFGMWEDRLAAAPAAAAAIQDAGTAAAPPPHEPVAFVRLVWLYFWRSLSQQLRHPVVAVINNALVFVAAIFLAVVYYGDPSYVPPEPLQAFAGCPTQVAQGCQVCIQESGDQISARGIMCVIAMGLTGVATFLPVFGSERIVYWREASALPQPLHTLAYFLGKDLAMMPQVRWCLRATSASPLCRTPLAGHDWPAPCRSSSARPSSPSPTRA